MDKTDESNVHTREGLLNKLASIHHAAYCATIGEDVSEESYFVLNSLENLIEEVKKGE